MKKVRCLYRVSSRQQLHEDDIPLQRKECKDYIATHKDWIFENEYIEKGISGYRKSVNQRDVLIQIMDDASKGQFDVLLVYMSDRLGRREDETPFYVANLNNNGIEVWSVKEGRIETSEHVDKLINYIRFWQAEGESRKTGMRVRDAQIQMIKSGKYTGGYTPFGYKRLPTGGITNRGRVQKDLFIDEEQAKIVQKIFEYAVNYGYGAFKIAKIFNEERVPYTNGGEWKSGTISSMLKNPIYMGYPAYARRIKHPNFVRLDRKDWIYSEVQNPQYMIVSKEIWEKAQQMREARKGRLQEQKEKNFGPYPISTSGMLALIDLVYCGYCGKKLTNGSRYDYWTTKEGEKKRKVIGRYRCNSKAQGSLECEGKALYRQEEIEPIVFDAIGNYLDSLGKMKVYDEILEMQETQRKEQKKLMESHRKQIESVKTDIKTMEDKVPYAIRGEFALGIDKLSALISEKERELQILKEKLAVMENEYEKTEMEVKDLEKYSEMVVDWRKTFEDAPMPMKRVMLNKLVERIEVKRDDIKIKFKMRLEDFLPLKSDDSVVPEQGL